MVEFVNTMSLACQIAYNDGDTASSISKLGGTVPAAKLNVASGTKLLRRPARPIDLRQIINTSRR